MDIAAEVWEAVNEAAQAHVADIDESVAAACKAVRALDDYEAHIEALVDYAIQDMVYASRHRLVGQARKPPTDKQPTVWDAQGRPSAVETAYASLYDMPFAGKALGDVAWEDLEAIEHNETAVAAGHLFNAALARELRPLLKPGQRVREAVSQKKLRTLLATVRIKAVPTPSANGTGTKRTKQKAS